MTFILTLEYIIYLVFLCDARLETPFFNQHSLVWQGIGILLLIQAVIGCVLRFKPDGRKILVPYLTKYIGFTIIWMGLVFFDAGTESDEYIVLVGFLLTVYLFGLLFARYHAVKEMLLTGFFVPNVILILNNAINQINVFDFLRQIKLASFFSSIYSQRVRFSLGFPNPNTLGNLVTCLLCISFPLIAMIRDNRVFSNKQGGGTRLLCFIIVALDVFDLITLVDCGSRTGMACFLICLLLFVFLRSTNRSGKNPAARKAIRTISLIFIIAFTSIIFFDRFIYAYISGRHESFELLKQLKDFQYFIGRGIFPPGNVISYGSHLDNYYVYLILTTGFIGLFFIILLFTRVFKGIRLQESNTITYGVIGCFVADMMYGFGETCILYPMFPSAAIFIVLFISYSIVGIKGSSKTHIDNQ